MDSYQDKRVKSLPLAGTIVRSSGNGRLGALKKEVLSTSALCVSQVTVLTLLLVTHPLLTDRLACFTCVLLSSTEAKGALSYGLLILYHT